MTFHSIYIFTPILLIKVLPFAILLCYMLSSSIFFLVFQLLCHLSWAPASAWGSSMVVCMCNSSNWNGMLSVSLDSCSSFPWHGHCHGVVPLCVSCASYFLFTYFAKLALSVAFFSPAALRFVDDALSCSLSVPQTDNNSGCCFENRHKHSRPPTQKELPPAMCVVPNPRLPESATDTVHRLHTPLISSKSPVTPFVSNASTHFQSVIQKALRHVLSNSPLCLF